MSVGENNLVFDGNLLRAKQKNTCLENMHKVYKPITANI